MIKIQFSDLKKTYEWAVSNDREVIKIKGIEINVPYLKYMIEYAEIRGAEDGDIINLVEREQNT